jgi:hypothetical protein
MTLIAAYRPYGVPILFGDFLITGIGGSVGTSKKIYKISPNFVIGWTGSRIDARRILRELVNEFEDRIVTIAEVERYLTRIKGDPLYREDLFLVGWIIDDGNPFSFLWNIKYPGELFPDDVVIGGSGSDTFLELLKQDITGSRIEAEGIPMRQALYSVILKAAQLFSDESIDRINRSRGFGHGYEILYFDGSEFRYLENIRFGAIDAFWDEDQDTGHGRNFRYWYHYQSLGPLAYLHRYDLETGDILLELINPLIQGRGSLRAPRNKRIDFIAGSFRADYYALYFRFVTNKNRYCEVSAVLPEAPTGQSKYEKFIDGKYVLVYGEQILRDIYESSIFIENHNRENIAPIGWGGGESTENIVRANARFVFQAGQNDKTVVGGLINNSGDWGYDYQNTDFAFMCRADATIQLYERGNAVGPIGVTYRMEDVFILELVDENGQLKINYLVNNHFLYQSFRTPVLPLKVVVAAKEEGASIGRSHIIYL